MKHTITTCAILILQFTCHFLHAQFLGAYDTVAHYPLTSTASDVTGMYTDMELINVPFADTNGVYCNGIYINSGDPEGSLVRTPHIDELYHPAFAVSVEFKIDSLSGTTIPVIICGDSWRYLGFIIRFDGVLLYDHNDTWSATPADDIAPGVWHKLTCIYTIADSTAQYWMDGNLLATVHGVLNRPANDGRISNTDFGFGWTFKGYLRNFTIFSSEELISGSAQLPISSSGNIYPNPVQNTLSISMPESVYWFILDLKGISCANGFMEAEKHIDVSSLLPGPYILTLVNTQQNTIWRSMLIKQ